MTLEERVARWSDKWIRQGIEQGMEQGIEQGVERGKREQLRRLAEVRFGTETADHLLASLWWEHDLERLDAIAEVVVCIDFGDKLLRAELPRPFGLWLWVLSKRKESADDPALLPQELTLEDVQMLLEGMAARWPSEWIRRGIEQGIEPGIKQGIERGKREQLRRLAEARFGAETAERLAASLTGDHDAQRLDVIAEAMVRCNTGGELLRQAMPGGLAGKPDA